MPFDHDEIVQMIAETIVELEVTALATVKGKRERELTLQSSGFTIVQVETEEEALAW